MSALAPQRTIHLASDHAGFALKEACQKFLEAKQYKVVDHGATTFSAEDDFPDYISLAAFAVSSSPEASCAIIFGGSGQGEAMLANRYPNVRATVYYGGDTEIISLSRQHNDANVLSLGARFLVENEAFAVIEKWLTTEVESIEKYGRRNRKIEAISRKIRTA